MNRRVSYFAAFFVLFGISFTGIAHEIWLERENNGSVRLYLGEPGQPDSGDDIDKVATALVFQEDKANSFSLTKQNDHWQTMVRQQGDIRAYADSVWQPWEYNGPQWWQFWKSASKQLQGGILEARTGRVETSAKLNYELVPVTTNGNEFVAMFQGKPLAGAIVSVLAPSGDEQDLVANQAGVFSVDVDQSGRYLLSSVHSVDVKAQHSGKQVDSLMYITSLTFLAD